MTVLPVVAREMGVLARRKSMYWSRWVTAVLALLVMLWLLVVSASQLSFAQLGSSIFLILSSLGFTFTVLIGTQATADCLSEEKREGTLGLLFLTDLKGLDVIGGKLAASSLQAALALIGVIPMISLSLLLGGVTLQQFGKVSLVMANTMFLSLAVGAFVSSISRNERKAMMGTFVLLLVIVLGPWGVGFALRQYFGFGFPVKILALSPLYDFLLIHSRLGPGAGPSYFWHSLVANHFLAWSFLAASAWILPRCVNELPARRFRRIRQFADNFVYGRLEQRKQHRAELLDRNAFLWLASRERVKPRYAWGVLAFFIGLYLWIAFQFDDMVFDIAIAGAMMFLAHLVFKIWAASEVCSRLLQDRRSGALELLLSTPLSVRQIAEGQSLALRRLFLKPIILLLILEVVLLYGGLNGPRQNDHAARIVLYAALIGTFLVDLWALKWVGLWLSLTGKSIERVLLFTLTRVLFLPWLIYAAAVGFFGARIILMGNRMDAATAIFGWGLLAMCISITIGYSARERFLSQFRDLAAKRFDIVPESEPEKPPTPTPKVPRTLPRRLALAAVLKRNPAASAVVFLLLAVILIGLGRSEYWSYRLKREIASISAQGFPATHSQVSRYHPALPSEANAFAMLRQAGVPGWPAVARNRRSQIPEDARAIKLKEAYTIVDANPSRLEALWRLPNYQRAYIDPLAANLWQEEGSYHAYAAIAEADLVISANNPGPVPTDRVERSIRSMLVLARFLRQQPLGFAQRCATETLRKLSIVLQDIFKRDILDETILQKLAKELSTLDDPTVLLRTVAVQRAFFLEPPPEMWGVTAPRFSVQPNFIRFFNSIGTRDKAMVRALEQYQTAIEIARSRPPRQSFRTLAFDQRLIVQIQQMRGGAQNIFFPPEAFWIDDTFITHLRLIETAIALERYQRKHRSIPSSLGALVPEFLPSVPLDPYAGKPLSSLRSNDALLVYSVGMDQRDETAADTKTKRAESDIVFRFH